MEWSFVRPRFLKLPRSLFGNIRHLPQSPGCVLAELKQVPVHLYVSNPSSELVSSATDASPSSHAQSAARRKRVYYDVDSTSVTHDVRTRHCSACVVNGSNIAPYFPPATRQSWTLGITSNALFQSPTVIRTFALDVPPPA